MPSTAPTKNPPPTPSEISEKRKITSAPPISRRAYFSARPPSIPAADETPRIRLDPVVGMRLATQGYSLAAMMLSNMMVAEAAAVASLKPGRGAANGGG